MGKKIKETKMSVLRAVSWQGPGTILYHMGMALLLPGLSESYTSVISPPRSSLRKPVSILGTVKCCRPACKGGVEQSARKLPLLLDPARAQTTEASEDARLLEPPDRKEGAITAG